MASAFDGIIRPLALCYLLQSSNVVATDTRAVYGLPEFSDHFVASSRGITAIALNEKLAEGSADECTVLSELFKLPPKANLNMLLKEKVHTLVPSLNKVRMAVTKECGEKGECVNYAVVSAGIGVVTNLDMNPFNVVKPVLQDGSPLHKAMALKTSLEDFQSTSFYVRDLLMAFENFLKSNDIKEVAVVLAFIDNVLRSEKAFNSVLSADVKQQAVLDGIDVLLKLKPFGEPTSDINSKIKALNDELSKIKDKINSLSDALPKALVDEMDRQLTLIRVMADPTEQGGETMTGGFFNGVKDLDGIVAHVQSPFVLAIIPGSMTKEQVPDRLKSLEEFANDIKPLRAGMEKVKFSDGSVQNIAKLQGSMKTAAEKISKELSVYLNLYACTQKVDGSVKFHFSDLDSAKQRLSLLEKNLVDVKSVLGGHKSVYEDLKKLKNAVNSAGDDKKVSTLKDGLNGNSLTDKLKKLKEALAAKEVKDLADVLSYLKESMFSEEFKNWARGTQYETLKKCLNDNGGITQASVAQNDLIGALKDIISLGNAVESEIGFLAAAMEEWEKLKKTFEDKKKGAGGKRKKRRVKRQNKSETLLEATQAFAGAAKVTRALHILSTGGIEKVEQLSSNIDGKVGKLTDPTAKNRILKLWTVETKNTIKKVPKVLQDVSTKITEPPKSLQEFGDFCDRVQVVKIGDLNMRDMSHLFKLFGDQQINQIFGPFKDVVVHKPLEALKLASLAIPNIVTFLDVPSAVWKQKLTSPNNASGIPSDSQGGMQVAMTPDESSSSDLAWLGSVIAIVLAVSAIHCYANRTSFRAISHKVIRYITDRKKKKQKEKKQPKMKGPVGEMLLDSEYEQVKDKKPKGKVALISDDKHGDTIYTPKENNDSQKTEGVADPVIADGAAPSAPAPTDGAAVNVPAPQEAASAVVVVKDEEQPKKEEPVKKEEPKRLTAEQQKNKDAYDKRLETHAQQIKKDEEEMGEEVLIRMRRRTPASIIAAISHEDKLGCDSTKDWTRNPKTYYSNLDRESVIYIEEDGEFPSDVQSTQISQRSTKGVESTATTPEQQGSAEKTAKGFSSKVTQEVVRKSAGGEDGEKKDSDDDSGSIVDWSEEERVILGPFGLDDDTDSELQLDEPQEASSEANASSSSGCSRLAAGRSEDGAERRREKLMRDIVKVAGKMDFDERADDLIKNINRKAAGKNAESNGSDESNGSNESNGSGASNGSDESNGSEESNAFSRQVMYHPEEVPNLKSYILKELRKRGISMVPVENLSNEDLLRYVDMIAGLEEKEREENEEEYPEYVQKAQAVYRARAGGEKRKNAKGKKKREHSPEPMIQPLPDAKTTRMKNDEKLFGYDITDENGALKINELIASMISEEFHNIKGFRRNVYDLQKEQLFPMTSSETIAIITMFRERVKDEPALVTPCGEYIVIADLHGLYRDTVLMLAHGEYPFSKPMLFLGDIVDRGPHSVATMLLVMLLKLRFPNSVFVLRGNHELAKTNKRYGLYEECVSSFGSKKLGERVYNAFNSAFDVMPIMAKLNKKILAAHGGPSRLLLDMGLKGLTKTAKTKEGYFMLMETLWLDLRYGINLNDPNKPVYYDSLRVNGLKDLNEAALKNLLEYMKCTLLLRGHQPKKHGYEFFPGNRACTLFTAPNSRDPDGSSNNAACFMIVSCMLVLTIHVFHNKDTHMKDGHFDDNLTKYAINTTDLN